MQVGVPPGGLLQSVVDDIWGEDDQALNFMADADHLVGLEGGHIATSNSMSVLGSCGILILKCVRGCIATWWF